jgi:hypothetical protein
VFNINGRAITAVQTLAVCAPCDVPRAHCCMQVCSG